MRWAHGCGRDGSKAQQTVYTDGVRLRSSPREEKDSAVSRARNMQRDRLETDRTSREEGDVGAHRTHDSGGFS